MVMLACCSPLIMQLPAFAFDFFFFSIPEMLPIERRSH